MTGRIRYESTQEPLDDEERELMNPNNWDWDNPIEGVTVGDPGAILSVRFTFEEYDHLFEAAHAQGLSTHEFIRQIALARLPHEAPR